MKSLGTILPTRASFAINDKCARENERARAEVAKRELSHLQARKVGDESRFYASEREYAIVSRSLKVLWFEKRADGEWYSKNPFDILRSSWRGNR